jgi:DNA-directed RNA polymerase subunit RPC12/RpoP
MFEPEYQNIDCPQCLLGKIYFDREMGYYCMLCGQQFSVVDIDVLFEKIVFTTRPAQKSGKGPKKSTVEIKELPPRRAKVEHISHDAVKRKKPDR